MDLTAVAASAFACASIFAAMVRSSGRQRISWMLVTIGLAGWVTSDVMRAYGDIVHHARPQIPSLLDIGYLIMPIGACLSVLFTGLRNNARSGMRLLLDGLIVATSAFIVLWAPSLNELFNTGNLSGWQFAVLLAYPLTDLVMLSVTLLLLSKARNGDRLTAALLSAALIAIGASHGAALYFAARGEAPNSLIRFGWITGMYLVGLAGLVALADTQPLERPPDARPFASHWLPYLPLPFALALGGTQLWPGLQHAGPTIIAVMLLIGCAVVRQSLLLDENRQLLVTVARLAMRDPLTGLANRTLFSDRLGQAMDLRGSSREAVSVLSVDLDDFKLVNDSLGHPAGDALLRDVAKRIEKRVRERDTVARLGGDEFAVLIEGAAATGSDVAHRVLRAFDEPFVVDGRELYVRLSVGLASASTTDDADMTADELFKRADLAMYSAKNDHDTNVRMFSPDMRARATHLVLPSHPGRGPREGIERIELITDLRRAIDEDRLTVLYQPKLSLSTGAVVGVEALVRWPHPDLGILQPSDFLPLVRQHGLMAAVTDLVISRAIQDAVGWYAGGLCIPFAINVCAPTLLDKSSLEAIPSTLARHGLPADALTLEITEDTLSANISGIRDSLDRIRDCGVRVAIDDFGTGRAGLTCLHKMPIDELKLDREFIMPILHDRRAATIVRAVIEMADEFGVSSVAKGVEDKATATLLAEYGCQFAQGFYFSVPISAEEVHLGFRECRHW